MAMIHPFHALRPAATLVLSGSVVAQEGIEIPAATDAAGLAPATEWGEVRLAGGCFWGM